MNIIKRTDFKSPDAFYYSNSVTEVRKIEKDFAVQRNLFLGTAETKQKKIHGGQLGLFSTDCLWGLKQNPFVCLFVSQFHFFWVPVTAPSAFNLSVSWDLK